MCSLSALDGLHLPSGSALLWCAILPPLRSALVWSGLVWSGLRAGFYHVDQSSMHGATHSLPLPFAQPSVPFSFAITCPLLCRTRCPFLIRKWKKKKKKKKLRNLNCLLQAALRSRRLASSNLPPSVRSQTQN